jgi:two-component system sensor kinase FixL
MRNAMEAMDGAETRELSLHTAVRDGDVLISVQDSGNGIPPEIEAKLFQPFITTKADGMGIGLSVCRTIVEAHGGRIWVERNTPSGSIFRFTLPTS